jgi:hypothetical protein
MGMEVCYIRTILTSILVGSAWLAWRTGCFIPLPRGGKILAATGQAVPLFKRLVAGFPPQRSGFASGWRKWHWDRFSPSTSVSPANHSTNFSIIIITRGWHNRPISDCSAEWTQLHSTPTIPIYCTGDWMGPKLVLERFEREIFWDYWEPNPGRPDRKTVTVLLRWKWEDSLKVYHAYVKTIHIRCVYITDF